MCWFDLLFKFNFQPHNAKRVRYTRNTLTNLNLDLML